MPVYLVAQIRIEDPERYSQYEAGFMPIFQKYGGEILAVDDAPQVAEGDWPYTRMVLLRFADRDAADAWYRSEEYQALAQLRLDSSTGTVAFVQGIA
jgi:uncharacterized protein (DUF1330 family)